MPKVWQGCIAEYPLNSEKLGFNMDLNSDLLYYFRSSYIMNSDLVDGLKKWENFVNGNKIIFCCLYIALWSSYNMNSDLLDGSKRWENFVNGNKIIFGCHYMLGKIQFTLLKRLAFGQPF